MNYKRPPIIEAVIEIRLDEEISDSNKNKIWRDFIDEYPLEDMVIAAKDVEIKIDGNADNATTSTKIEKGLRRLSANADEVILLWKNSFIVSQLAPYPGWEAFIGRFEQGWSIWKKTAGYKNISRIGVRYINRIDIPSSDIEQPISRYLSIYPNIPETLGSSAHYAIQTQIPLAQDNLTLTISSSLLPPTMAPLLNHKSYIMDIDIGRENNPPQNDIAILELLNNIREIKNQCFESCITQQARNLFNHD